MNILLIAFEDEARLIACRFLGQLPVFPEVGRHRRRQRHSNPDPVELRIKELHLNWDNFGIGMQGAIDDEMEWLRSRSAPCTEAKEFIGWIKTTRKSANSNFATWFALSRISAAQLISTPGEVVGRLARWIETAYLVRKRNAILVMLPPQGSTGSARGQTSVAYSGDAEYQPGAGTANALWSRPATNIPAASGVPNSIPKWQWPSKS